MAIYHLSVKAISRSAGRSSTAAAAYRAGEKIIDERTGEIHDYTRRRGVESADIVLPDGAPEWATSRVQLWNAAELAEKRKDACVAREYEVALPAELSAQERRKLALDFAKDMANREGCAVDVAIHAPGRDGDIRNHHAHILRTTRKVEAEGLGAKLDTEQAGRKRKNDLEEVRERWASFSNAALERAGVAERIDHRTLQAQAIDRAPTQHLGPAASGYERRTGLPSDKRQEQERDAIERLTRAKEAGELERAGHQLDRTILDLSGDLKTALAERDRQQRAAEQQRRDQEEQRRTTERMTADDLAAEIARLRPLPVDEVAKRQPEVVEATRAHQVLMQQRQAIQADQERAKQEAQDWRAAHPIRAKGHDAGAWKSDYLAEREQTEAGARQQLRTLALQLERASRKSTTAIAEAVTRIEQEQAPILARIAQLEQLQAERHSQEERQRAALYQEEQRQREERERAELQRKHHLAGVLVYAAKMHQEGQLELPKGGEVIGQMLRVMQAVGIERRGAVVLKDLDGPSGKQLEAVARKLSPQVEKQLRLQEERDQEEPPKKKDKDINI